MSMSMLKTAAAAVLATLTLAVYPMIGVRAGGVATGAVRSAVVAASATGTTPSCLNGATPTGSTPLGTAAPGPLTFPTGCYGAPGGTRCTGTLVGVYGSSALKSYLNNVAADYCAAQQAAGTPGASAADVEYLGGGESCSGDNWAGNNVDGNEVGLSEVFPGSCTTEGQPVTGQVEDHPFGVNVVDAIATCPGATRPQGAALNGGGTTPCKGPGSGAAGSATYCAPADGLSTEATLPLFTVGGNFKNYGGCNNPNSQVQQRQTGAGDRVTWCFAIYRSGNGDLCNNLASQAPATSTADMLDDVCGTVGGGAPLDGGAAIGYVSRAAIVADPRLPASGSPAVLRGCGIVPTQGSTGYNQNCDPATATAASPNVGSNPGSHAVECLGDQQVSSGAYPVWGYAHLALHDAGSNPNNAAAASFVDFVLNTAQESGPRVQAAGLLPLCQMQFKITLDGAPTAGTTATC